MKKPIYPARLNLSNLRDLTIEYGENWGYAHVCRVLHLVKEISSGLSFNQNVILYAAYLHDWGAYPRFSEPGVEHALRSMQLAEEILPNTALSTVERQAVLDAIAQHDYRDRRPAVPIEALILREADMLDMLGVIGILREFARGPKDLRICYERVLSQRAALTGRFSLPRAQSIAAERFKQMDHFLAEFVQESYDNL